MTRDQVTVSKRLASLAAAVDQLSDREKYILKKRYGIEIVGKKTTYEDIAKEFNVTRERIRQIEVKMLKNLSDLW